LSQVLDLSSTWVDHDWGFQQMSLTFEPPDFDQ